VKDENTKTVALYARVSTLDQNCNLQFADLRRYASQRFNRAYEYVDEGVSGTQRRRPALDNLMKDAQRRMFDVVLVLKFDRFARSLKHLMDSLEDFGTLGIDFVSYTEGGRYDDAQWPAFVPHRGGSGTVRAGPDRRAECVPA
jgi:DNA invertase Pin-like site-specific DNA recombinase